MSCATPRRSLLLLAFIRMYTHTYMYIYIYMYTHTCIYMYLNMHACTYTYDNVIERKREVHNMSLICPTYVPNMSLMSLIRP